MENKYPPDGRYIFGILKVSILSSAVAFGLSALVIREWGYDPHQGKGTFFWIWGALVIYVSESLIDYFLRQVGLGISVRSALWGGSLVGGWLAFVISVVTDRPALSLILGIAITVFASGLFYRMHVAIMKSIGTNAASKKPELQTDPKRDMDAG